MKLVFMGTPAFAVPALEAVLAAGDVAAVVTREDKPRGRGLRLAPPAVAVAAAEYGLEVFQPRTLVEPDFAARLRALAPDLLVVVAFGRIIPPKILAAAPGGGINLHPSLLPRYRGAAPIPRAIAAGETETGVTVLHLSDELDAGDIILQRPVAILPVDTAATLEIRLAGEGAALLVEALRLLEANQAPRRKQDSALATYAPKLTPEEALIHWDVPASKITNLVRAFDPWPVAYALVGEAPLRIWRASVLAAGDGAPGTVLEAGPDGIVVAAGQGAVRILEVQPPSRRRMSAAEYLRGHPLVPGSVLRPP